MKSWQSFTFTFLFSGFVLIVLTFVFLARSGIFFETPVQSTASVSLSSASPLSVSAATRTTQQVTMPVPNSSLSTSTLVLGSKSVYQYKMLYNVGACGLSKFGKLGWLALQFGDTIQQSQDLVCENSGGLNTIFSWVLLQMQIDQN